MPQVDFSHFTLAQFTIVLIVAAVADWIVGTLSAIVTSRFSWALVMQVLRTHVLERVIPIALLFALGQSADQIAIVALADAALAGYYLETADSLLGGTSTTTAGS